jgi:hypothetical protein
LIDAEEHVGLKRAYAGHHSGADLSGPADDGDSTVGNGVGEAVGLLYANVRDQGAGEHGQNEDAGADAELGFEFHAVL